MEVTKWYDKFMRNYRTLGSTQGIENNKAQNLLLRRSCASLSVLGIITYGVQSPRLVPPSSSPSSGSASGSVPGGVVANLLSISFSALRASD